MSQLTTLREKVSSAYLQAVPQLDWIGGKQKTIVESIVKFDYLHLFALLQDKAVTESSSGLARLYYSKSENLCANYVEKYPVAGRFGRLFRIKRVLSGSR
jgi:hypothetical protein